MSFPLQDLEIPRDPDVQELTYDEDPDGDMWWDPHPEDYDWYTEN